MEERELRVGVVGAEFIGAVRATARLSWLPGGHSLGRITEAVLESVVPAREPMEVAP